MVLAMSLLSSAIAQKRNGAHDLRDALVRRAGDATATCVFCHTPQGFRPQSASAPRWQRDGSTAAQFGVYGATSVEPSTLEGGASLLCLSCHDASQAPAIAIGSSSDHPVGVSYAGLASARSPLPALQIPQSIDLSRPAHGSALLPAPPAGGVAGFRAPSRSVINDRPVWWVATSPNSARRTRSDLPLFANGEPTSFAAPSQPKVECATCHDPHNDNESFLRVSNEGSRLCLSCHNL